VASHTSGSQQCSAPETSESNAQVIQEQALRVTRLPDQAVFVSLSTMPEQSSKKALNVTRFQSADGTHERIGRIEIAWEAFARKLIRNGLAYQLNAQQSQPVAIISELSFAVMWNSSMLSKAKPTAPSTHTRYQGGPSLVEPVCSSWCCTDFYSFYRMVAEVSPRDVNSAQLSNQLNVSFMHLDIK